MTNQSTSCIKTLGDGGVVLFSTILAIKRLECIRRDKSIGRINNRDNISGQVNNYINEIE